MWQCVMWTWWWRHQIHRKSQHTHIRTNGIKSYKSANFWITTMKNSNLMCKSAYGHHYLKCKLISNSQNIYKLKGGWIFHKHWFHSMTWHAVSVEKHRTPEMETWWHGVKDAKPLCTHIEGT